VQRRNPLHLNERPQSGDVSKREMREWRVVKSLSRLPHASSNDDLTFLYYGEALSKLR